MDCVVTIFFLGKAAAKYFLSDAHVFTCRKAWMELKALKLKSFLCSFDRGCCKGKKFYWGVDTRHELLIREF